MACNNRNYIEICTTNSVNDIHRMVLVLSWRISTARNTASSTRARSDVWIDRNDVLDVSNVYDDVYDDVNDDNDNKSLHIGEAK